MKRRTSELMRMLNSEESLETYLAQNEDELLDIPLCVYLNQLLRDYRASKNEVIKRSGLNEIYGYQIFAGTKMPSRDKLIALVFGFPLRLVDAQRVLRIGKASELYPRKKRDSVILFGLKKGLQVQEVDDLLFELGEETIL